MQRRISKVASLSKKTEAESQFTQNDGLLTSLKSQMDKSDQAQQKFYELQGERTTEDFSATIEAFKTYLTDAGARHRIEKIGFKNAKEQLTEKADLKNFAYDVMVRDNIEITFSAISDVHVFSLISDLQKKAPGLVLIKKVEIKRANKALDLSEAEIAKLKTGAASLLVEGTITMTWIRFIPKETKTNGAASPAPAAPAP